MARSSVPTLLRAVGRRLWRGQFVAASRRALWGSAGLLLCAVVVHLALRPVPVGAVMIALALLWVALLARAAAQRPAVARCALWADRHLGGASAFSTWLDLRHAAPARRDAQAARRLEDWASARVTPSLRLLAEMREPARLARPLSAMLICAGLAALVLRLPELAATPARPAAVPAAERAADAASRTADAPFSQHPVREIASALRHHESQEAPERAATGQAPAPASAPGRTRDADAEPVVAANVGTPAGERSATPASPAAAAAAGPTGNTAAGAGAGRKAGDGLDERANGGVSQALPGTMAVQRVESKAGAPSAEWRADLAQAALYDDALAEAAGAATPAKTVAPAATPPAATSSTRMTPTEASYVQAWMKANGPRQ